LDEGGALFGEIGIDRGCRNDGSHDEQLLRFPGFGAQLQKIKKKIFWARELLRRLGTKQKFIGSLRKYISLHSFEEIKIGKVPQFKKYRDGFV
jgi:hypothetical protein